MTLCGHGYYPHDCKLCEPRPGECDYGSCERHAEVTITQQGSLRPMCAKHGKRFAIVGWLNAR